MMAFTPTCSMESLGTLQKFRNPCGNPRNCSLFGLQYNLGFEISKRSLGHSNVKTCLKTLADK